VRKKISAIALVIFNVAGAFWIYNATKDHRPPFVISELKYQGPVVVQTCSSTVNSQTVTCTLAMPPKPGDLVIINSMYYGEVKPEQSLQLIEVERVHIPSQSPSSVIKESAQEPTK